MEASPPSASMLEMNELILPQHANNLGTAFGGTIMSWIDVCAAMVASRHARCTVVTASMDQLDFIAAIRTGQLVSLKGMVNFVGRSSMEIGVRVEAEELTTGARFHAASAYLTFVAIDSDGKSVNVRPLRVESHAEKLREREAIARRAKRLALAAERKEMAEAAALDS
jgi:acyl-CoA hydrolase